jgi:hypothetical protein
MRQVALLALAAWAAVLLAGRPCGGQDVAETPAEEDSAELCAQIAADFLAIEEYQRATGHDAEDIDQLADCVLMATPEGDDIPLYDGNELQVADVKPGDAAMALSHALMMFGSLRPPALRPYVDKARGRCGAAPGSRCLHLLTRRAAGAARRCAGHSRQCALEPT